MNFNTHKREGMSSSPRETSPKKQKLDKTGQRDGNGDSERKAQEQTNEAEMNEEEQEEDEEEYEEGFLEEESTTTLSGNGPLSAVYVLFRHDKLERLRTVLLTHGVPEESPAFLTAPDAKDLTIKQLETGLMELLVNATGRSFDDPTVVTGNIIRSNSVLDLMAISAALGQIQGSEFMQLSVIEDPDCVPIAKIVLIDRHLQFKDVSLGPSIIPMHAEVFE